MLLRCPACSAPSASCHVHALPRKRRALDCLCRLTGWPHALLQPSPPAAAEEAARCYDRAAIKTRGPTAELNFPYAEYADDPFLKASLELGRCFPAAPSVPARLHAVPWTWRVGGQSGHAQEQNVQPHAFHAALPICKPASA